MYRHYIFTATSYTKHRRVAIEVVVGECEQNQHAKEVHREIMGRNIHSVPVSLHVKDLASAETEDVKKSDPYFEKVYFCKSVDEFMEYVNADLQLSSIDIAAYILSRMDAGKLKLQKLVYLCYEAYLKQTGQQLFDDGIYAFQYGPVAEDFYYQTRDYKDEDLRDKLITDFDDHTPTVKDCRMARAEDGLTKMAVIKEVLQKYGDLSAHELVALTHQPGTAWETAYDGTTWKRIPDSLILRCAK